MVVDNGGCRDHWWSVMDAVKEDGSQLWSMVAAENSGGQWLLIADA